MWRQKSLREKEIQELERVWGLAPYESEDQPGSRAILDRRCPCRRLGYHGRAPCRNSAIAPGGSRIDGKLGLEPLSRFPNTAPACGATANTAPGANEFARLPKAADSITPYTSVSKPQRLQRVRCPPRGNHRNVM